MKALHKISESILYYLSNKWPDNIATINKPDFKKLSKNERNYIYDIYPGLKDNPKKIVDIRKHKDLNHITHKLFKETALKSGFLIEKFEPVSARDIKPLRILIQRIPF